MHRRRLGVLTALFAVAALALGLVPSKPAAQAADTTTAVLPAAPAVDAADRPNIVLITADDMRADDIKFMPRTRRLLGKAGVTFTDAMSNYPLCCPARATLLTGQFNHNNGVLGNEYPYGGHKKFYESGAEIETLPVWLKRAGYNTGFVGKYLNYYGTEDPEQGSTGPRYVPPGWDDWHASIGRVFRYYCVTLNDNGALNRYRGEYQTDLYTRLGQNFINKNAGKRRPFFLWASHLAPHIGVTPAKDDYCSSGPGLPTPAAQRHKRMFTGMPLPYSAALNEQDMSDKGTYIRERKVLDVSRLKEVHQGRIEALQSLDESVAETIAALDAKGVLDKTMFIFASDNGWLLGEHRLEKKILPYEESLTVPLLMRGPGVPSGVRRHQPVGLVDIPATVLQASGASATKAQDGTSLIQLAKDPARLARRVMPIESGPAPAIQGKRNAVLPAYFYRGVRSSRYAYYAWQFTASEEEEFYDLDNDPFQLTSRHGTPSAALEEMRTVYRVLRDCAGAACIQQLPEAIEDGRPAVRKTGDTAAPRIRDVRSPRGWLTTNRATIRYSASDPTDPAGKLRHWCSHQAIGCDGTATLRIRSEGRQNWTIHVTDRAGNIGSAWGRVNVDLTAPLIEVLKRRSLAVEGTGARLPWRVYDLASGVKSVDTRRRTAGLSTAFTDWQYPARLQNRDRAPRRTALPARNGTVCLEVRARDVVGRQSSWTGQVCRARAVDAATLATAQWRNLKRDGWYGGTATSTKRRGAALVVPSAGRVGSVRVVARTGPGMGRLRLDVGGTVVARINLDRSEKGLREFVFATPRLGGKVKATVTSAGLPVSVDSIGVVRRLG
jgi:arylsulfatase A-like enzyme